MKKMLLRPSQIIDYQKCSGCYYVKWIKGEFVPANPKMTIGSAVDAVQNLNFAQKITSGHDITVEEATDMCATEMDRLKKETVWDDKMPFDYSKDVAIKVSQFIITKVSPLIMPTAVQIPFILETDLPFDLTGTMDYTDIEGRVRDMKVTSKKGLKYYKIERGLQAAAYCFAHEHLSGKKPKSFIFDRILRPEGKSGVGYEPLEGMPTLQDLNHFWKCAIAAHKGIQAGVFMPAWEEAWWCDGLCNAS